MIVLDASAPDEAPQVHPCDLCGRKGPWALHPFTVDRHVYQGPLCPRCQDPKEARAILALPKLDRRVAHRCVAYRHDGTKCGDQADFYDPDRKAPVCRAHFAETMADILHRTFLHHPAMPDREKVLAVDLVLHEVLSTRTE